MKKASLTLTLTGLLALTACGGNTEAQPEPGQQTETEPIEPPEEPASEVNERGSHVLEVGEDGGVTDDQGEPIMTFTVNDIEVHPECTGEIAEEPEHEAFVMFDVEISSDLAVSDHYVEPGLIFNPFSFSAIDTEGTTRSESPATQAAFNCLPESEQLPPNLGPGENASGKVVFDVPSDVRTLMTGLDVGENLQWEWNY